MTNIMHKESKVMSFSNQNGLNNCRPDFPMLRQKMSEHKLIYFDSSATTLKPIQVIEACSKYYTDYGINIRRGDYSIANTLENLIEQSRSKIANFLNCQANQLIFTSGATESLNIIAYSYGLNNLKEGDIVLSSKLEHASSILPWFKVCEATKAKVHFVNLENNKFTLNNFAKAITPKVKILVLAHVNNVLGYEVDLKNIVKLAHEHNIKVVIDCTQSVAHQSLDFKDLDIDFAAFSAHKMLGPTGLGLMYAKQEYLEKMPPLFLGGGSNSRFSSCGVFSMKEAPAKFESGTANLAAILGFSEAIKYIENIGLDKIATYEKYLMKYLLDKIKDMKHITIYNPDTTNGILCFNCKGIFAQDAAQYFSKHGIALRSGHHCTKMSREVLETAETLRISLYIYNTCEEIDYFVKVLADISLEKCIDLYI